MISPKLGIAAALGIVIILVYSTRLTSQSTPKHRPEDELEFVRLQTKSLFITFSANKPPDHQLLVVERSGERSAAFYNVGDTIARGRFKIVSYEGKEYPRYPFADVSELKIEDLQSERQWLLIRRQKTNVPELFAEFLRKDGETIYVREGNEIELPSVSKTYRLTAVSEVAATLTGKDGEVVILRQK
ncbi:MAG: hypothetical protein AAGH89_10960 [Verrucomicrobiota bacterium]